MDSTKPPEFEPPQACVNRVIKSVLPESVQVTKEARAAFTRAAGIFIFYLTHCANDFAKENKRQTIYPQDVMDALKELDFDDLTGPLSQFLADYRKELDSKKPKGRKSTDDSKGVKSDGTKGEDDEEDDEEEEEAQTNGVTSAVISNSTQNSSKVTESDDVAMEVDGGVRNEGVADTVGGGLVQGAEDNNTHAEVVDMAVAVEDNGGSA